MKVKRRRGKKSGERNKRKYKITKEQRIEHRKEMDK
jgi:hypothetical protein